MIQDRVPGRFGAWVLPAVLATAACGDDAMQPAQRLPAGPACEIGPTPRRLETIATCSSLLAVDDTRVYFQDLGIGAFIVLARDKCGDAPVTLVHESEMPLTEFVSVGDLRFTSSLGAVLYLPPDNRPAVPVIAGLSNPHALTVDGKAIVFATDPMCTGVPCENPMLWRLIVEDGQAVVLHRGDGHVRDIAVTASWIYFSADLPQVGSGGLHRVPRDGNGLETLPFSSPDSMVADRDAEQLFFNDGANLVRLNADGASYAVLATLSGPTDLLGDLALDPAWLYVPTISEGLLRVSRQGGAPAAIFPGTRIDALAIDQEMLYLLDCRNERIVMLAR